MSADNTIIIQKKSDSWVVNYVLADESRQKKVFDNEFEAYKYAFDLADEIGCVEYGVNRIK